MKTSCVYQSKRCSVNNKLSIFNKYLFINSPNFKFIHTFNFKGTIIILGMVKSNKILGRKKIHKNAMHSLNFALSISDICNDHSIKGHTGGKIVIITNDQFYIYFIKGISAMECKWS